MLLLGTMPMHTAATARLLFHFRKSIFCSHVHPTVEAACAFLWRCHFYTRELQLQMAEMYQQLVPKTDLRTGKKHLQWEAFNCGCLSHCKRAFL